MEYEYDIFWYRGYFLVFNGIWYGYKGVFLFFMEYDMGVFLFLYKGYVFLFLIWIWYGYMDRCFLVFNGIWYGYKGVFLFLWI